MFTIVPLLCFAVIFLAFQSRSGRSDGQSCWRSSLLSASVVWGVVLTAMTEILSIFKFVTFGGVITLWGVVTALSASIYFYFRHSRKVSSFHRRNDPIEISLAHILLLCGVAAVACLIGLIAVMAPPNNYDSLTYHMARVVHWIQNRTVDHYPTHILRQLYQTPWAEFTILHLQILSGGDHFANLVQWFSMVGSILGVSLIAKHLGADQRGQIFAAVILATLPMGILQASSTQNDYVVSYWLICVIHYTLLLIFKDRPIWPHALGIGASLGLALLTKGTAYILALPFLVWLGIAMVRRFGLRLWNRVAILVTVAVLINIGHYGRNIDLFGAPLSTGQETYFNETLSMSAFISNVLRNTALHMGTPIGEVNRVAHRTIRAIHSRLGIDINDPRTTFGGSGLSERAFTLSTHEDRAGNTIHFWLIIMAVLLTIASKNLRRLPGVLDYLFVTAGTGILFCLIAKWQPWNSRLHLPIFAFFVPICAIALGNLRWRSIQDAIVVMLLVASSPWVFYNKTRPLIGKRNVFAVSRVEQYFVNRLVLKDPFVKAARGVRSRDCRNIGVSLRENDWEYPIWVLIKPVGTEAVRVEHVDVLNQSMPKSTIAPFVAFRPCAIISVNSANGRVELRMLEGALHQLEQGTGSNPWRHPRSNGSSGGGQ